MKAYKVTETFSREVYIYTTTKELYIGIISQLIELSEDDSKNIAKSVANIASLIDQRLANKNNMLGIVGWEVKMIDL